MEQELQKQMETLLDLFEHEGWGLFIEEQEKSFNSLKDSAYIDCNSNEDWQIRRGVLATLNGILNYETTIKYVIEQNQGSDDEL